MKSKKGKERVAIKYSDNASKMNKERYVHDMSIEIFSMRENRVRPTKEGISSNRRRVKQVYRVTVEQHRLPETSLMLLY